MTDLFSHGYVAPGVFVQETSSPISSVVGIAPTVVGVVGPSIGHRTVTDTIVLTGTTPAALKHLGVIQLSIVVKGADGTLYSVGSSADYTIGTIANSDPGKVGTTITRVAGGNITSGQTVYITYNYADDDFFLTHQFSNLADFQNFFGPALDPASNLVTSPLSLAAQAAFQNGAAVVVGVSTNDTAPSVGVSPTTTRAALALAYGVLASSIAVNVVVPVTAGLVTGDVANTGSDLATWLAGQEANGIYRIAILAFDGAGVTTDPGTAAQAIVDERIVVAYPWQMNYFNGFNNTVLTVGGSYLAAAYAGRISSLPVNTPLTKKPINGFNGIPGSVLGAMTVPQKNTWSSQGVSVAEINRNGILVVRAGVTTEIDTIYNREISLVRIKDGLVNLIADSLDAAGFVGQPIDLDTPVNIKGLVTGVLNTALTAQIITGYTTPLVRQTSIDPSVIQVTFSYQPAFPLNYIVVTFSVNVATGDTLLAA